MRDPAKSGRGTNYGFGRLRKVDKLSIGIRMSHKIARVCGGLPTRTELSSGGDEAAVMDEAVLNVTVTMSLREIRRRLDEVASIAKAAEACAAAGNIQKGVEIVLDVEQFLYEVSTFLNAASLMHRLHRDG